MEGHPAMCSWNTVSACPASWSHFPSWIQLRECMRAVNNSTCVGSFLFYLKLLLL